MFNKKSLFLFLLLFAYLCINVADVFAVSFSDKDTKFILKKYKNNNKKRKKVFPGIIAISGTSLNKYEKTLIKEINPYGIILMKYNIKSKKQLGNLRKEIESLINRHIVFFIDQEGGRVNRLSDIYPNKVYPAPYSFNSIAEKNLELSKKEVYKNANSIAKDLKNLNIDVNIGLVLDVLQNKDSLKDKKEINSINNKFDIGDRSFSSDPHIVKSLAGEYIKAFNDVGVDIVAKHFMGLGSSNVNTHKEMAVINKSIKKMNKTDFLPFKNLKNVKYGLVAHAIYTNIDSKNPSLFSKKVISFIRNELNFHGILISDDINMGALNKYSFKEKIEKSLNSGIDLVLIMKVVNSKNSLNYLLNNLLEIKNKI